MNEYQVLTYVANKLENDPINENIRYYIINNCIMNIYSGVNRTTPLISLFVYKHHDVPDKFQLRFYNFRTFDVDDLYVKFINNIPTIENE